LSDYNVAVIVLFVVIVVIVTVIDVAVIVVIGCHLHHSYFDSYLYCSLRRRHRRRPCRWGIGGISFE
jgi:hypothetical protein